MWKTAAGTIAVAAVMAFGGAANADDKNKPYESGEKVEKQSGTEQAVDLKNIHGEHAKNLQQSLKDAGFYDGEVDGILGVRTQAALEKFQESKGMEASGKLDNQTASALGIEFSDIQPVRGTEPMEPTASPTPGSVEPAASPTPMKEEGVEPQSGTEEGEAATPTPPGEVETQSGIDTQAGESTSPVSGGETEAEETEATSGDTLGGEPAMGEAEEETVETETEIEPQAGTSRFDKETIRKVEQALKDKNLFDGKVDGVIDVKTTEAIRRFQTDNGMTVTGKLDPTLLQKLGVSTGAVSPTPGMETPAPTPME